MKLSLSFIQYDNPTDEKATNVRCDQQSLLFEDLCDTRFDICVSELGTE